MNLNCTLINNLKDLRIPMDQLGTSIFVMYAIDSGRIDLLDEMDDHNRERRMVILYRELQKRELLEPTPLKDPIHFRLTAKGQEAIDYIKLELQQDFLTNDNVAVQETVVREALESVKQDDARDWILEYIEIFPIGMIQGKRLRTSSLECGLKMQKFIENYKFDKETILEAARLYIREEEGGNQFTRNSSYFISKRDPQKGEISDLLAYCERIQSQKNAPIKYNEDVI